MESLALILVLSTHPLLKSQALINILPAPVIITSMW